MEGTAYGKNCDEGKKPVLILLLTLALVLTPACLAGCGGGQISPEDAARADAYGGAASDIPITVNLDEEELTAARSADILEVRMETYPSEELSMLLFDLSLEQVEMLTERIDQVDANGEVYGWATTLNMGERSLTVTASGRQLWFSAGGLVNLYRSVIGWQRLAGTEYDRYYLRERFPRTELSSCPSEQAYEACAIYMDKMGYSRWDADIYAMDLAVLEKAGQEYGLLPEGRQWEEGDECYLLIFQPYVEEYPICSPNAENAVVFLYVPEQGIIFLDASGRYGGILSRQSVELVTAEQALLQLPGLLEELQIAGTALEVEEIGLGYLGKVPEQDPYDTGAGRLTPCYAIRAAITDGDGQEREEVFLVDAVTGQGVTYQSQFR